ncbi:MAG: hypothetical protein HYV03_05040 [Deltaproteobacteria bacterium]|nr:hypothetical protein [Deltaproteobacteria bacterium]
MEKEVVRDQQSVKRPIRAVIAIDGTQEEGWLLDLGPLYHALHAKGYKVKKEQFADVEAGAAGLIKAE